jgi:organic radical activating enzyme
MSQKLPLMEYFYSIQGEGFHSGKAAIFIRLAGCDVGCVWCDVKDSWNADNHQSYSSQEILGFIKEFPCKTVIITGGEPCMYDLTELTTILKNSEYDIHLETSGAYPIIGYFDWITFSPKKFKFPLDENGLMANELKVIVFNKSDFMWAEQYAAIVNQDCLLYLQPEWEVREKVHPHILDYVQNNPQWRICLQTHKYLNVD